MHVRLPWTTVKHFFIFYFPIQFNSTLTFYFYFLFSRSHKNSFIHYILIKTHQLKRLATYKQQVHIIPTNHKRIRNIYYCYYYYVDDNDDEGSKFKFLKNENLKNIVFYLVHKKKNTYTAIKLYKNGYSISNTIVSQTCVGRVEFMHAV
jgi:hypothetical protein